MLKAALVAGSVLGDLPREGLRIAGAIALLFLLPVLLVVIATAALIAMLLGGFPGFGSSDPPPVPPEHLAVMLEVSAETGVPWELLAAIASVESGFGANMATSSAGAIGYGQFLPSSWEAFGEGGDPYDYRDAIPAMARYLVAAGVATDVPQAVYAYNHSWEYVALVLGRASYYAAGALVPMPTPETPLDGPGVGLSASLIQVTSEFRMPEMLRRVARHDEEGFDASRRTATWVRHGFEHHGVGKAGQERPEPAANCLPVLANKGWVRYGLVEINLTLVRHNASTDGPDEVVLRVADRVIHESRDRVRTLGRGNPSPTRVVESFEELHEALSAPLDIRPHQLSDAHGRRLTPYGEASTPSTRSNRSAAPLVRASHDPTQRGSRAIAVVRTNGSTS